MSTDLSPLLSESIMETAETEQVNGTDLQIPTPDVQKEPVKHKVIPYNPKWERVPEFRGWLRRNPRTGSAQCIYCDLDFVTDKGRVQVNQHLERVKHRKSEKLWWKTQEKVNPTLRLVGVSPRELISEQVRQSEAQVVAFLAENKLPLSLTEPLITMLKELPSIGDPVQRLDLDTDKVLRMIKRGLPSHLKRTVIRKLASLIFSLVFEEVRDGDDNKFLALCVCYRDDDLHIQVDLLDIFEETQSDIDLFHRMKETLTELEEGGVPIRNWVGFVIDTKDTLFITTHQIALLISEYYPWVISIRSPCHMTDQATASACQKFPPELESFCKTLHRHFDAHHDCPESLVILQAYCRLGTENRQDADEVNWLSVQRFIKHITELWAPLLEYFTSQAETEPMNIDWTNALTVLKEPLNKVIFQFVEHVLSVVSSYNKTFQTEELSFFQLEHETTELVRKLALSFMSTEAVKSFPNVMVLPFVEDVLLPLTKVYIGLDASSTLDAHLAISSRNYESPEIVNFFQMCQQFYKDIILEIQSRFDFSHPVFHLASIIDPENARNMQPPTLTQFFANYDHPNWNKSKIETEWRAVSNVTLPSEGGHLQSPQLFWEYVFSLRSPNGGRRFGNLRQIILFFLSLPISSIVGLKVEKFLECMDMSTRIGILKADVDEYHNLLVHHSLDADNHSQVKRRRIGKKENKGQG